MHRSLPHLLRAAASLVAAVAACLPSAARAATVLLVAADDEPELLATADALVATGLFASGDLGVLAGPAAPDPALLATWDVVLVWADAPWDDAAALGDVLADLVDDGGEVVLASHALEDGFAPGGRWLAEGYSPLLPSPSSAVPGDVDLSSPLTDLSHPAMESLASVAFPDRSQGAPVLAPAGQLVAVDSAGNTVVADACDRSAIAVNLFPPDLALGPPSCSEDSALLLAQAILATQMDALPSAATGGPYEVDEGGTLALDGSGSDEGDLGPLAFSWDLDGDGVYGDSSSVSPVFDASTLSGPLVADVGLLVADSCGRTATAQGAVTVLNVAPAIDWTSQDGPVEEGSAVHLSASASDPGGDPLDFSWDPGDGSPPIDGNAVEHPYADDGTWTATLTVDDGDGGTATAQVQVEVTNASPAIGSLVQDGPAPEGGAVHLSASASDPGDDPLVFSWDFGDGSPPAAGATAEHAWADDGTWTVTLTVDDGDGGTATAQVQVEVTNASPAIGSLAQDGPVPEGSAAHLSASASDPGDDPLTFSWDFGDGSPPATGPTAEHAWADDGTWTVTLTVQDGDGGSTSAALAVVVTNAPPVLSALVGDGAGVLGEQLAFAGAASDPALSADVLSWTWEWGDGGPSDSGVDLASAGHAWTEPGTYTVTLVVADEDGGSDSASIDVLVQDQGPTIGSPAGPASLAEGEDGTWSVAATGPLGGPVLVAWDWGDGSPVETGQDLLAASHAFADDGARTVQVVATDPWGGQASQIVAVTVANLPPSFTVVPPALAEEGSLYTVALAATDVAADRPDLAIQLDVFPPGATFDGGTGFVSWEPVWPDSQAASLAFEALVSDGDGGQALLSWQVAVAAQDADADGMPDGWELEHGLDPGTDDGASDWDADGISSLDEWLAGSDPQAYDGPGQPEPLSPIGGEPVATATPEFLVGDAIDPGGDPLTYDFEVYAEPSLATLLDGEDGVPSGGSGTTPWTGTVPLPEDALAFWRARARDSRAAGPWTVAEGFFVDVANGAPSAPLPLSPAGSTVDVPVPELLAAPPVDPEGEALDVTFELSHAGGGPLLETIVAAELPSGLWRGVPLLPLTDDVDYSWAARAVDERGGDSGLSAEATFHVDATNRTPDGPVWEEPHDGSTVDSALPLLAAWVHYYDGLDWEGDPVVVRFQIDVRLHFDSPDLQELGTDTPDGEGRAEAAVLIPLPENRTAWARARSEDDRGGASAWTAWSFLVNAVQEPPGLVRVVAPGEGEAVDGAAVVVRWAPTADPDEDELTYEVGIVSERARTEAGEPDWEAAAWTATGLPVPAGDPEGQVAVDVSLPAGAWLVRSRATDEHGLAGDWGPIGRFVVLPVAGQAADLGAGEGPYGCACSQRQRGQPGWLAVVLLALPLGLRRRRSLSPARGGEDDLPLRSARRRRR